MNTLHQKAQRGLSYLEVVLVVVLIGSLIAVAAARLLPYVDHAERIAVLRLEGQLRSVLLLEAAKRISNGESESLTELHSSNPMALLLQPPANYLGELTAPVPHELPERTWHFDTERRQLVYRAGSGFRFEGADPVIHDYRVELAFEDVDQDAAFVAGTDEFLGLRLMGPGIRFE
ncbi:MAG: hypothetical protein AAFN78_06925 [Pseudomonadota bacterium]